MMNNDTKLDLIMYIFGGIFTLFIFWAVIFFITCQSEIDILAKIFNY